MTYEPLSIIFIMNHGSILKIESFTTNEQRRNIMPKGDSTGPEGKGPKTGRGLGKSAGNDSGQNVGRPRQQHTHDRDFGKGQGNRRNRNH